MIAERGIRVDHSTIHRWVLYFPARLPDVNGGAKVGHGAE